MGTTVESPQVELTFVAPTLRLPSRANAGVRSPRAGVWNQSDVRFPAFGHERWAQHYWAPGWGLEEWLSERTFGGGTRDQRTREAKQITGTHWIQFPSSGWGLGLVGTKMRAGSIYARGALNVWRN